MTVAIKNKKIKILYFIHSTFFRGGAGKSIYEVVKKAKGSNKYDIEVLMFENSNQEIIEKFESLNVQIHLVSKRNFLNFGRYLIGYLGGFNVAMKILMILKDILFSLLNLKNINEKVSSIEPDIIHLNSSVLIPQAFFIKKKFIKLVHIRESLIEINPLRKLILKFFLKRIHALICISEKEFMNYKDLVKSPIKIIGNPIESDNSHKETDKEIKVVGCLSGFNEIKGGLVFLKSFKKLDLTVEVKFAGPIKNESKYSDKITKEITTLRMKKNINIQEYGLIENVKDFISNCGLIVVPHTRPHFSRVIIESWALRKPVITFSDPWTEQLNRASNNALILVDKIDSDLLSKKIEEVFSGKINITDKIKKGFNYWKKNHDPSKIFIEVDSFYDEINKTIKVQKS